MEADTQAAPFAGTLAYLPVALFASVMGLSGLALAWQRAHAYFGWPLWVSEMLGWTAMLSFVLLSIAYGVKAATSYAAVHAEFRHPVAGNLFGTALISMLLVPMLLAPYSMAAARLLWAAGAAGMTLFAWTIVSRWLSVRQDPAHATPAWIVPVVGLLDIPLAVPALQWPQVHGVMVFALSVGLFFAVPLLTLILSRLMFQPELPAAMQPALLIMVAPFSVGFSAYVATTGQVDGVAQALYMLMLFMLPVLMLRLRHFRRGCPFRLSWWAVSFPLAASAGAGLRYAEYAQHPVADAIAMVLLAIASIAILGLLLRTLQGIVNGELAALSS
jgi:tellurite resistance protein